MHPSARSESGSYRRCTLPPQATRFASSYLDSHTCGLVDATAPGRARVANIVSWLTNRIWHNHVIATGAGVAKSKPSFIVTIMDDQGFDNDGRQGKHPIVPCMQRLGAFGETKPRKLGAYLELTRSRLLL